MTGAVPVGGDRYTAPGNRWDLIPLHGPRRSVSVIVPYFEQQAELERLLVGIELQEDDGSLAEVIVGDDGSSRPPQVPDWYDGPPISIVRQDDLGVRPAAARNLAASHATGDVLVFLDADMVPTPSYVAVASALPMAAPEALVVGTRRHRDLRGWDHERVERWLRGGEEPPPLDDPEWLATGYRSRRDLLDLDERSWQWIIGAVLTISRPIFEEVGGFDSSIVGYGAEDWDLAYRVQQAGGLIAHVPAVAHHDGLDWRGRVGRTGTKNGERHNLVERIPGLADPVIGPRAYIAVTVDSSEVDVDEVVATTADLLAVGGSSVAVAVVGSPHPTPHVLAFDPRVHWGGFGADADLRPVQRWHVHGSTRISAAAFTTVLQRLAPGGPARVVVEDHSGVLLDGIEERARRRAARWSRALDVEPSVLLGRLFGEPQVFGSDIGVERGAPGVDLAGRFPR